MRAPRPCGLGAQRGGEGGQKGRRSFPPGVPGKPREGIGGAQPPDEEEEWTRRPLTGGGGAGDDEAGGLAEPLRHGGAGRRGRRPSPHAARPRMRRGSRGGNGCEGSGHERPAAPFKPPARRPRALRWPLPAFPLVVSALLAAVLLLVGFCVDIVDLLC